MASLVIIALGIMLLLDKNPFKKLPQSRLRGLTNPFLNAYVFGLLCGSVALPCSGPFVVGMFAIAVSAGELFSRLSASLLL